MKTRFSILVLAAASQLGATDCGGVIRDPGFDLWCGDSLCSWKVVRGDVQRVDTWHPGDSGVELLGVDVAIAQLTPVNHNDGTCIKFDMIANVEEDVEATLGIDVYGDGTIEEFKPIPKSNWKPLTYQIKLAKPYTGIRFELAKRGAGRAVFANISAEIDRGCDGFDPIVADPAPLGAYCLEDAHCKSGLCRMEMYTYQKRCVACEAGTCGADVCGIDEPVSPVLAVPVTCVPAAGDELGEQCATGAECASGICTNYACSTCGPSNPCANGETCDKAWMAGPHVCSPGAMRRTSGEPCATDSDCASGTCNGAVRKACFDNRPCGNETNCPVGDGLRPAPCEAVGVTGGTCS